MYTKKHTYSDGVYNKNIVILGPIVPPLGGVAVHIERVTKKLRDQGNHVLLHDSTREKKRYVRYWHLCRLLYFHKPDIVYYHTLYHHGFELFCIVFYLLFFNCALITIAHNCRYLDHKSWIYKKFFSYCFYNFLDRSIVVGDKALHAYIRYFYSRRNHDCFYQKISVESPFLPPDLSAEQAICATYPLELDVFLSEHSPLLATCAYKLVYYNGADLYGFDQCLALLDQVRKKYPRVGMVFALADSSDSVLYQKFLATIAQKHLEKSVYILDGQRRLWPLLKRVDVFVRATLTDGYGISVAEGLYCGARVVASDVCARPKGVFLYASQDVFDLTRTVLAVLNCVSKVNLL